MPTYDYGNTCFMTETPWINDCMYDGVGAFMNQFYAKLAPKGPTPTSLNLISINVDNYMPSGWSACTFFVSLHPSGGLLSFRSSSSLLTVGSNRADDASLSSTAYLYVSPKCTGNTTCSLHVGSFNPSLVSFLLQFFDFRRVVCR